MLWKAKLWAGKLVNLQVCNAALAADLDSLRHRLSAVEAAKEEADLKLAYAKNLQVTAQDAVDELAALHGYTAKRSVGCKAFCTSNAGS